MFVRKLLVLGSSLLLAGAALFATAETLPQGIPAATPAEAGGLPVTDLPEVRVTPVLAGTPDGHAPASPQPAWRMPYYSFGSTSPHILEKD